MTKNILSGSLSAPGGAARSFPEGKPRIKEVSRPMKKRILALLVAVCLGVSMLVLPASAAGSNTAVQTAAVSR